MSEPPPDLSKYHAPLLLWANSRMPAWLRGKLDPEDLVQQALLEAHGAKFAVRSDLETLGYLRRVLTHNLIDAARKFGRAQTDVSPDEFAHSSVRLADWLAADHTSPSERADRNERFERLAAALADLPDAQRIAVEMRYLQKMKIADIALALNRGDNAVSQLLHRAVTALRDVLTA